MEKLISSNNYSVLALLLMMRNNEFIGNYILDANENNAEADWDLGEISETMAELLNIATNDEDTTLTKMMLSYFNQRTSWEVISYKTKEDFDKCRGYSHEPLDFFHEVADTTVLLSFLDENEVVKLRTSDGEESLVYRQDECDIKLLRKLRDYGVYCEFSQSGLITLFGVHNTTMSDVIETIAHNTTDSELDADSEDFIKLLRLNDAKLKMVDGFITFTHI